MSCFGCGKKYGLFCKEHGCPNCGYSYCAKCLKRPMAVPRHDNKVLNVCLICYDKLSKIQATEPVIDCEALPGTIVSRSTARKSTNPKQIPVDDLLGVTVNDAEVPEVLSEILQPISNSPKQKNSEKEEENAEINENLDCVISKRLKNLKTVDNPMNDADIRERLSNLSGMPQKDYSKKDLLLSTDTRTDQEKMRDLLEQFASESQLDQRMETERNDSISDIEKRLRALRGDTSGEGASAAPKSTFSPDTNTPSDNEQDDETMLKDIMQKYLAEARLPPAPTEEETELMSSIPAPPEGSSAKRDLEELPWCNVCNEDATIRCKGCDGELFCAQCFRECHDDDEEYRLHEKVAYTAPPKFKENHF